MNLTNDKGVITMKTPNAEFVCNSFFNLKTDCFNCPIKKECDSKPIDSSKPLDWEQRIEEAATEYLKGSKK